MKIVFVLLLGSFLFACSSEKKETKKEEKKDIPVSGTAKESTSATEKFEKVEFPSIDSLLISANLFEVDKNATTIILCHQARFNKFEYAGIALRLNKMGFNCLAIDQRSGGPIATFQNETFNRAISQGKGVDYLDAEQDMVAAINWAYIKSGRPVILWGSSYSSTLALYIAIANDKVGAVISFSPGNYFADVKGSFTEMLPNFKKPMFITSTKYESTHIKQFMANVKLVDKQILFTPETEGHHGSRALWENQPEGQQYWKALIAFLNSIR